MSDAPRPAAPPEEPRRPFRLDPESRARVRAVLQNYFRPLGRPVVWTAQNGTDRSEGFLLQGGVLFDVSDGRFPWKEGQYVTGSLAPLHGGDDETPEFAETGPLLVEMDSGALGGWGAFDPRRLRGLLPFDAEEARTREWIRESMGESEFAWDCLAVERSMLRAMMGAVYFDASFPRFRLAELLFDSADQVEPEHIRVAASLAEFDGQGKVLSNDFYLARPGPSGCAGPRERLHKHLLLNSGRFLCNYKRRFAIQNAFNFSDERRVETHRYLLISDLTEEAKRAVWLDWSRQGDWPKIPRDRYQKIQADLRFLEIFDAALRAWKLLANPSDSLVAEVREACLAVARRDSLAREAALYAETADALDSLEEPERLARQKRLNSRLTLFALEGRGPDASPAEWREFAQKVAAEAQALDGEVESAAKAISNVSLRERLSKFFEEFLAPALPKERLS
jgi:hypothetical protein